MTVSVPWEVVYWIGVTSVGLIISAIIYIIYIRIRHGLKIMKATEEAAEAAKLIQEKLKKEQEKNEFEFLIPKEWRHLYDTINKTNWYIARAEIIRAFCHKCRHGTYLPPQLGQ